MGKEQAVALAYAHFYDQRGGGIETEFKEDQQGLGLSRRSKKSFYGQARLVQLATLAHNVLIWARSWLSEGAPQVTEYGLKRLVRDLLNISGGIIWNKQEELFLVILNRADQYSKLIKGGLAKLLAAEQVVIVWANLGDTASCSF